MRPRAPPLLFWKVRASTTCSRVTLFILVSTRPIGRPWSWSIGGMPVAAPPAGAGEGVPPPPPVVGGFAPPAGGAPPALAGLRPGDGFSPPADGGRRPADGLSGPAEGLSGPAPLAAGRGAPAAPGVGVIVGFFPGSG